MHRSATCYCAWLSGFIEAESCYSARKDPHRDVFSFSIGQNNDNYLIESIKYYFKAINDVREPSKNFYLIEIYRKETLLCIYNHIHHYPLLGHKRSQFLNFYSKVFSDFKSVL